MAGYDLSTDRLYGHVTTKKGLTKLLAFMRHLRSLHPPNVRIAIVCDNFSPPVDEERPTGGRVGRGQQRRAGMHADLLVAAQPDRGPSSRPCATSLSTAPITPAPREQASMIRRYLIWRNRNAHDRGVRELVKRKRRITRH